MAVDYLNVTPLHWAGRPQNVQILNKYTTINGLTEPPHMGHWGYPVGIYGWPVPVVISGSLVSSVGDHDGRPQMTPLSLDPYRY